MVKSLLENQTLFLEKYLHELIPAVTTCIVARQLCTRPEIDNHWALRDFATRLTTQICKNFNTSTNNIQTRMTRMFSDALKTEKTPLVSMYGSLAGLHELGPEVIKSVVIPEIRAISERIDAANANMSMSNNQKLDTTAVQKIRTLVQNSVVTILKATRSPTDTEEIYLNEFGSLGTLLFEQVQKERQKAAAAVAATISGGISSPTVTMAARPVQPAQNLTPQMINAGVSSGGQKILIMNNAQQSPGLQPGGMPIIPNQGMTQQRVILAPTNNPQHQQRFFYPPSQS